MGISIRLRFDRVSWTTQQWKRQNLGHHLAIIPFVCIIASLFGIMPRPSLHWPRHNTGGYDLSKSLAILPFPPRELIPV